LAALGHLRLEGDHLMGLEQASQLELNFTLFKNQISFKNCSEIVAFHCSNELLLVVFRQVAYFLLQLQYFYCESPKWPQALQAIFPCNYQ
jgi:hypothetical protein